MTTEGSPTPCEPVLGVVTFSHGDHFLLLFCDDVERMLIFLIRVYCIRVVTSIWFSGSGVFYHPLTWCL